jgi:DNA-binding YbaB/EbfC family protein
MKLGKMMKQARKMAQRMEEMKSELAHRTVTATSGGGAVQIEMTGEPRVRSVTLSPEAVDPAEIELLEDLVLTAVNAALRLSSEMVQDEMGKLTGGLGLPGLGQGP